MQLFLRLPVRTTGRSIFERKRGYHLLASLHAIQLSLRNLSVKSDAMANQKPPSKANLEWTAVATGLTLLGDWLANFVLREYANTMSSCGVYRQTTSEDTTRQGTGRSLISLRLFNDI